MANRKLTTEDFLRKSIAIHGDFYDYSKSVYTGAHSFLRITCPIHGDFDQRAGDHMNVGKGCHACGTALAHPPALTREAFLAKANAKHGDTYDYSLVNYVSSKTPITIICREHGEFTQRPSTHMNGAGCLKCGRNRPRRPRSKSPEKWIEGFKVVHGDRFDYSGTVPINKSWDRITVLCKEHGEFTQLAKTHARGHGCPYCPCSQSKPEKEIHDWLLEVLPGCKISQGERKLIAPFELDLFLPDYNLAIEFNGSYWHNEEKLEAGYHQKKTLLCAKKGISLIHVYEYDWDLKKTLYKNIMTAKLKILGRKFNARSLEIREVPEYKEFLEANHFQGNVHSTVQYGLFEGGDLKALMTFGRPRYTKACTWELLRFCTLAGIHVRGGASRLFRHFVRNHLVNGDTVISYARMDYSNGAVYEKLGFSPQGISEPGYVWVHKSKAKSFLPRYNTQKHKLKKLLGKSFEESLSEVANMKKAGYSRVYTAGNLRYIYTHADS